MSFASHTTSLLRSSPTRGGVPAALHFPATSCLARSTAGVRKLPFTSSSFLQCNAISRAHSEEYIDVIQYDLPSVKWRGNIVENDTEKDTHKKPISDKIRELVGVIRSMLQKMDDGVTSISPYDTAWVALVEDIGGSGQPQFPSSLEWISNNQLADGSWGDSNTFLAHDRIISTLACVIALTSWKMHPDKCDKDVFKQFENGGEFFCCAGQSNQAVTGMYNLYRASQVMFPGENILADANKFSAKFLQEKRANNELLDKWIITKDLPGEVGYALDVPWYASQPRVEARFFLEQYGGGDDDVWIGKTLYRMPYVNNNTYLELAKLNYNNCQALHQHEWKSIQK